MRLVRGFAVVALGLLLLTAWGCRIHPRGGPPGQTKKLFKPTAHGHVLAAPAPSSIHVKSGPAPR